MMSATGDFNLLRPGAVDAPYELLSRYTHVNGGGVNILYIMQDLLYTVQNIIAGIASVSPDPPTGECERKFKIDVGQGRPRVTLQYDEALNNNNNGNDSSSDEREFQDGDDREESDEDGVDEKHVVSQSDLVTSSVPLTSRDNSTDTWSSSGVGDVRGGGGGSPVEEIEVVPDVAMMCKDLTLKSEPADDVLDVSENLEEAILRHDGLSANERGGSDVVRCAARRRKQKVWRQSSYGPRAAGNQVSIVRVNPIGKGNNANNESKKKVINISEDQISCFNTSSSITISRIEKASSQRYDDDEALETALDKCAVRNVTRNVEYSSFKESYHIADNGYCGGGPSEWSQGDEFGQDLTSMNFHVSQRYPSKTLYPCRHCGKQFRFLSQKDIHERVHTGEKPFKCIICKKRFSQIGTKRRHERTHSIGMIDNNAVPGNVT